MAENSAVFVLIPLKNIMCEIFTPRLFCTAGVRIYLEWVIFSETERSSAGLGKGPFLRILHMKRREYFKF